MKICELLVLGNCIHIFYLPLILFACASSGQSNDNSSTWRLSLEPRPLSLRSAPPSRKGPGKTASHLGNCKVHGSVRSHFHRFSPWPSLACPATRWAVLTSLGYNLSVFVTIDKAELPWRKVSDWQAVGHHRQSHGEKRVRVLNWSHAFANFVSFLSTLMCHFCFKRLTKKKPIDEDLVEAWSNKAWSTWPRIYRKRRFTEGVREPATTFDRVHGFAFFKRPFAMQTTAREH